MGFATGPGESTARPAWACGLALFLSCVAAPAHAGPDARGWLERMAHEGDQVNFRGTVVHMCGGKVDIVTVVHRADNGRITERIKTLDADGREIIRRPEEVMCILPDSKTVMVGSHGDAGGHAGRLLAAASSFAKADGEAYRLRLRGEEHVAGYAAQVIEIDPADAYRYGHRIWIGQEHALPLRYELVGENGRAIEQTLFTEIEFTDRIRAADVEPTIVTDGFTWREIGGVRNKEVAPSGAHWRVGELPAGFVLVLSESGPAGEPASEHLVYSDGIASVSIFIEADVDDAERQPGRSEMGAMNAYTTTVGRYLVTAVGDVPLRTAQMIATSVAPAGP